MKIKQKSLSYNEVISRPKAEHKRPVRPDFLMASLERLVAIPDLMAVNFKYEKVGMEKAGEGPWLVLMNHSSFLDLSIASAILYPKRYNIVITSDGIVGKEWLMRRLGCIPTQKFVSDISLVSDIRYAITKNNTSVLMYPEASYSFDGTATALPRKMGNLFKLLNVPVIMITTQGSFARDPLYNCLQKRKVDVSAKAECLFTPEEIKELSVAEIDKKLDDAFSFDYFRWQKENGIKITEPFRADGLNRILYKCPNCNAEGSTEGKGISFVCHSCGKEYTLNEDGQMSAKNGKTEFSHIPDWYRWQRQCVKQQIEDGTYIIDTDVDIGVIVDTSALYMVGSGHLKHDKNGFTLTGCDGQLSYEQKVEKSYSLYSDYYWYEIGDVICIGNKDILYYCFPKQKDIVAKARIAAEELYKVWAEDKKTAKKSQ